MAENTAKAVAAIQPGINYTCTHGNQHTAYGTTKLNNLGMFQFFNSTEAAAATTTATTTATVALEWCVVL